MCSPFPDVRVAGNDTDDTLRPFPQHSVGMCQLLPLLSDL